MSDLNERQRRALEILAREDHPLHPGRLAHLLGDQTWSGRTRAGLNTLGALERRGYVRWILEGAHSSSKYEITAEGRAALA